MRKSKSLKMKLFTLMTFLVFLQSLALVIALSSSRVLITLDDEAFRLFENTIVGRAGQFNKSVGDLMANVALETKSISQALVKEACEYSLQPLNPQCIYSEESLYETMGEAAVEAVLSLIRNNDITGAFLILDGCFVSAEAGDHLALYLRDLAPNLANIDYSQLQMEIGPAFLSRKYQIALSSNWDMFLKISKGKKGDFYHNPFQAVRYYQGRNLTSYGYWATPDYLLNDGRKVITYTLPLIDNQGLPFGVIGIEISQTYFSQNYLPNQEIPYQNSFYALVGDINENLDLSWYLPGGPVAELYLKKMESLHLEREAVSGLWETKLDNLGKMYCSIQPLRLYNENSPFNQSGWNLVGFVSAESLHYTSNKVSFRLFGSIVATTLIAFGAIFALTHFATRKITNLSEEIKNINSFEGISFQRTGLKEIDDLTYEIEKLNRNILERAKITDKIMDLTEMPMGCFEIRNDNPHVTLTSYIYYLLGLPENKFISREEWKEYYLLITAKPTEEGSDVYAFSLTENSPKQWLRINETDTEIGMVGTILDVTQEIKTKHYLLEELNYDSLTKLHNRRAFKRSVELLLRNQADQLGAMIFLDLDNFKLINDRYGHDLGDQYLIHTGAMVKKLASGNYSARISGDEFAIYLHGYQSKEDLRKFIQDQYLQSQYEPFQLPDGEEQIIRYSGGIAFYSEDADNVEDLLKLADFAMYEAKHFRKGTLMEFNLASYNKNIYLLENREIINMLIDEEMIAFAFQPIVEIQTAEVYGYEALMRPLHESFNSPIEVLRVAATQFKLYQLERMLILNAMDCFYQNRSKFAGKKMFINSIPNQLLAFEDIENLKKKYSEIFSQIVIEFIESEIMTPEMVQTKVAIMRELGYAIAIDDFGAGFSNEMQVLALNPEIIKVDMGIIRGIDHDRRKQLFFKNILNFCHNQGIRVVAEGVETEAEFLYLVDQGVDFLQGYLLARPDYDLPEVNQYYLQLLKERMKDY